MIKTTDTPNTPKEKEIQPEPQDTTTPTDKNNTYSNTNNSPDNSNNPNNNPENTTPLPPLKELKDRQKTFCKNYCNNKHNATKAYLDAGYQSKDTKSASASGHKLLKKPAIRLMIERYEAEKLERQNITTEKVIAMLIKEIERDGPGTSQSARVQAITQLGRYLSMFTDNANINTNNIEQRMADADKRVIAASKQPSPTVIQQAREVIKENTK